ncbi:MAG: Grx4 family monothiol glutaredoxin [Polyangiaceae bacterium]|nr:Grx4 family monothiol glutaredoxin [Polyangiaceae bacterium]
MPLSDALRDQFQQLITQNKVVLFMKGTRSAPACGFSASVVQILDEFLPAYETVNVLSDPEVRDGIKEFSQWPTIPQLYVGGEFLGGSDIVREMHASGELGKKLGVSEEAAALPNVTITDAAAKAFRDAGAMGGEDKLHVEIGPRFEYNLYFGPVEKGEVEVTSNGLALSMSRAAARRAEGLVIDFVVGPEGEGFRLTSPYEPAKVKSLTVKELKSWLDQEKPFELFDVRTERERQIARIQGAKLLDKAGEEYLMSLNKDTPLVFQCHHGMRSRSAAEHFLSQGFKNVYNLVGGIDAWSQEVDPSVPRY